MDYIWSYIIRGQSEGNSKIANIIFLNSAFYLHIRQLQIYLTFSWHFPTNYKIGAMQIKKFSSLGKKTGKSQWTNVKHLQIFLIK